MVLASVLISFFDMWQFSQHHLLKSLSFLLYIFRWPLAWICLWAFYPIPLIYISVFVPVPFCLDYCSNIVLTETWALILGEPLSK